MRGTMRRKFTCPVCGKFVKAPVMDTEPYYAGFKRYRKCELCRTVFVTHEKVAYTTGRESYERKTGTEEGI